MASRYGTIHTNQPLTNILVGYNPTDFIADMIVPKVSVKKKSGTYYVYSQGEILTIDDYQRRGGTKSARIDPITASSDTYNCKRYSLDALVTDEDMENADLPIKLKEHAAKKCKNKILRKREYDMASYLFNTTTFSGYTAALTGTDRWNDPSSYPIDKVLATSDTISLNCGYKPNTMIMGQDVYTSLKTHPQFTNYVSSNMDKNITTAKMAEAFNIDRVIVGSSIYNSAKEGQTVSNARLWGKYVLLAYIAPSPQIDEPSLMYSFRWNAGKIKSEMVKEYRDETLESDVIEYGLNYDDKLVGASLGYLLSTVVS